MSSPTPITATPTLPHRSVSTLARLTTAVITDQWRMVRLFGSNAATRTPMLVIWVASFGGALHSSVTLYYYMQVGASDLDIGRIGFLQSLGGMTLSPLAGYGLDRLGAFVPLLVTATACAGGCLWRGLAQNVWELYWSSLSLGVGVNLWMVVLLHVAQQTPRDQRSQVLSGFAVQETFLRLAAKAAFPFWDWMVRQVWKVDDTLFRYRIHMGICSGFCLFGTGALWMDRHALQQATIIKTANSGENSAADAHHAVSSPTVMERQKDDANNHPTARSLEVAFASSDITPSSLSGVSNTKTTTSTYIRWKSTAILSALMIQSWSSTVVTVLWPLVLRDHLDFGATEYGILAFVSSLCATAAVAAFPTVERRLGSMPTAAGCATLASVTCLLAFCILPKLAWSNNSNTTTDDGRIDIAGPFAAAELAAKERGFLAHAVVAVVLHASLLALEPSLKSIFSLTVPVAAQGRNLGVMWSIGGMGGMGGNLMGTWMFERSKHPAGEGMIVPSWMIECWGKGSLPFVVVSALLGLAALSLWCLHLGDVKHGVHLQHQHPHIVPTEVGVLCEESGYPPRYPDYEYSEELAGRAASAIQGNINLNDATATPNSSIDTGTLRQQQQAQEGAFYPLWQKDTTYEMKLD